MHLYCTLTCVMGFEYLGGGGGGGGAVDGEGGGGQ